MKTVNEEENRRAGERRIILIRHGQTPDNVEKHLPYKVGGRTEFSKGPVISGHNRVGLTDEGVRQCTAGGERLARHLRDTGITSSEQLMLLTSDLPRTQQTLAKFVAAMPGFGLDLGTAKLHEELRERDAGELEGTLREEALREDPSIAQAFTDATYRYRGGESLVDCGYRAGGFLSAVARSVTKTLVVVTHEITILGVLGMFENGEVNDKAWRRKGHVGNAEFFDVAFNCNTLLGRVTYPA
ncbi:histidine phosphatase family protein [Rhizobacter sp. LjRoot28]|uniref:histidine phosphatase family protein n=1 Tax=Rhizobacter sp. LjRoot28 TaxID=3342309 RepID=UPI003ECD292B